MPCETRDTSACASLRAASRELPRDEGLHHLVGAIRQRSLLSHPVVHGALEELELDITAGRLVARGEFRLELGQNVVVQLMARVYRQRR